MELNWIQGLLYGMISGLAEFLPISAEAHRTVMLNMTGIGPVSRWYLLSARAGCLLALLLFCRPVMAKLFRERRLAAMPRGKRHRRPDMRSILDCRFLRTAGLAMILGYAGYYYTQNLNRYLWLIALMLACNGAMLVIPQYVTRSNKDSQTLSGLDAMLMGLSGWLGILPGASRVGVMTSAAVLRGADRRYAWNMCLLLSIPAVLALLGFDIYAVSSLALTVPVWMCILVGVMAALSAYAAMMIMGYLSVKIGFESFGYYCCGLGMFTFILYLWF